MNNKKAAAATAAFVSADAAAAWHSRRWRTFFFFLLIMPATVIFLTLIGIRGAKSYSGADAPIWAQQAVNEACGRGLIDCRIADSRFEEILNRAAGYQMLTKGFGAWSASARSPFTDIVNRWFAQAASTAYTLGWTTNERTLFLPEEFFTRAQIAVAVSRALGLAPGNFASIAGYPDSGEVPPWAIGPMSSMVNAGLIGQGGSALRPNEGVSKIESIVILNAAVTYAQNRGINVLQVAAARLGVSVVTLQETLNADINLNLVPQNSDEPKILNGDYCWRDSNGDGAWRRCSNLIINPGLDPDGPIPVVSSWTTDQILDSDRQNDPASRSLLLNSASVTAAVNDEYNEHFQPLYTPGVYEFSFWLKEDAASLANNDWSVRLKVRDWWDQNNMPPGMRRCYVTNRFIRRSQAAAAGQWQRYSFEFSVPLAQSQWDTPFTPIAAGCDDSSVNAIAPYDPATIIPSGYAIVIFGASAQVSGNIWLDDFSLVRK